MVKYWFLWNFIFKTGNNENVVIHLVYYFMTWIILYVNIFNLLKSGG